MYHNQEIERTNHLAGTSDATKSTDGASDDKDSRSGAFSGINAASDNEPSSSTQSTMELKKLKRTRASLLDNGFTSEWDSVNRSIASLGTATVPEVCSKRCWRCVT